MISFVPTAPSLLPSDDQPKLTLAALRARVFQLDPEIATGTSGFDAALILVVAARIGQNIDRISRFTGIPREQVAQRARRLVDNGVWCDGETVCRWGEVGGDVEAFRSDVAIAEGRFCRRINEEGEIEWAPQGYWRKHYEYAAPRGGPLPQVVCYHPHVQVPDQDLPYVPEAAEETAPEAPRRVERAVPAALAEPVPSGLRIGAEEAFVVPTAEGWNPGVDSTVEELFPDAVWLA